MPHDLLAIVVPTLTVVPAAFMNRADTQIARAEMRNGNERLRTEFRADLASVNTQLAFHVEQFAALRERLARLDERLRIPA